jgi:group I intron endonuclease
MAERIEKPYSVYLITNTCNSKLYVGISNSPKHRWAVHKSDARLGHGHCLHRAMRKHGIGEFEMSVIEEGLTETEAIHKEIRLIGLYNTRDARFGYNVLKGGRILPRTKEHQDKISNGSRGKKRSEEFRAIMSEATKRNWAEGKFEDKRIKLIAANKKKMKAVICNETGEVFESITQAARRFSNHIFCETGLSGHLRGKQKTYRGHTFSFIEKTKE